MRPAILPTFATDSTLSAGPQSGLSTRLDPGGGVRAQGFYQDRRVPARGLSWLLGNIGDWFVHLLGREHDVFKFTRTDLNVGSGNLTRLSPVQQQTAIGAPQNRQKQILVSGASSGSLLIGALLNDGTVSSATFTLAGSPATSAPASDNVGTIFACIGAGGSVVKTTDGGATSSTNTVTGASTINWVGATASHYLAWEASSQKLYIATALGGTWTNIVTNAAAVYDLITNGTGTWVIVYQQSGGFVQTMRSLDDGATWTAGAGTAFSPSAPGACWSADWQRFVLLDGLGKLWTSVDGDTWTLQKTVAALSGLTFGQNTVVACGPAIACIANRPVNSLGKYPHGIAYTLDQGATWNESYIGDPSTGAGRNISSLLSANGRIYALDGAALYQSGIMAAPPALFTGV